MAASQAGIELQMGFKLFPAYVAAGLPGPAMHGETILGGGPDFAGYAYLAGVFRSILPLMERFGIATPGEVDIDTLADRLREETVAGVASSCFRWWWARSRVNLGNEDPDLGSCGPAACCA